MLSYAALYFAEREAAARALLREDRWRFQQRGHTSCGRQAGACVRQNSYHHAPTA